jgi:DNA polymerase-3 subunit alpha
MQDLLMKMQPDRIEDLIAANALYRPGPMELIPTYCARKHGREPVPQVHPIMDAILRETYGIMTYQEDVMKIFNQLGGIELSNAYKLIKAISKKTVDVIAKFQPDFLKGAMQRGVSKEKAQEIFDLILKFGGYGFNKSHSTRYAIVAYQTAYLKCYHPVEYMSAVLTFEMGSTEKVVEYIEECRKLTMPDGSKGIKVLPPDINFSDKDFTPTYVTEPPLSTGGGKRKKAQTKTDGVIRFGLAAVRGVGEKAVQTITEERGKAGEFTSLYSFCERVDLRAVQRSTIEALIKCGAFSSPNARRSQLLNVVEKAFEMGQQSQNDKRSGQLNMFGAASATTMRTSGDTLPDIDEFENAELLKLEKELLGFYITSHPLTSHQSALERYTTFSTREANSLSEGTEVTIGGMISRIKKVITKNGRSAGMPMAIITLEDLEGQIDGTMFAETYAEVLQKYPNAVANESIVFVKGKVDRKRETPSILVNEVIPIEDAINRLTTGLLVKLESDRHSPDILPQLKPLFRQHHGRLPIWFEILTAEQKVTMKVNGDLAVKPSAELVEEIERLLGSGAAQLVGAGSKRTRRLQQQQLFKEDTPEPITPLSEEPLESPSDDSDM